MFFLMRKMPFQAKHAALPNYQPAGTTRIAPVELHA
jgi:hypothetical protein